MPCAYCGRFVEEPQWITTNNNMTNRQRLMHYYLNDNETCLYYTVCRPSCLLERLRREVQEIGLVDWQIQRIVELADLIEIEHTLQLEDVARAAPTPSGNLPPTPSPQAKAPPPKPPPPLPTWHIP